VGQGPKSADQGSSGGLAAAVASEVCLKLTLPPPDSAEIHRFLGYRDGLTPRSRVSQRIEQIVSQGRPLLEPRGTFSIYEVQERTRQSLTLAGVRVIGNVGEFLRFANRVGAFVVTAGEGISLLSEEAAKGGDAFTAWVLDALGSWAAEAAAQALEERIRPYLRDQEVLTLRYSPGYCGMDIAQQRALFQLVQADSVGVALLPSLLMRPLKSISGIIGLGPKEAAEYYRSPCDFCDQAGCHMRR
jgi:hypothetical protein